MPLLANRVQVTTTSTGTGTLTLGAAVEGYVTFNDSFVNGDVVFYVIDDTNGNWEVGSGIVGTSTLTRANVIESSNLNELVDFPAGSKRVFCGQPTLAMLPDQTDNSGKVLTTNGTAPSWTAQNVGITSISINPTAGISGTSSGGSTPALTLGTTVNGIVKGNGTSFGAVVIGSGLNWDGTTLSVTGGGGSGTVTSVSYTGDNVVYSIGPTTPVTTSGTLQPALKTQTANTILAGPTTGSAATPTFRSLTVADLPLLTASRALVSDGSGRFAASAVTSTELGYVSGVTSAIQTQLNNKAPLTPVGTQNILYGNGSGGFSNVNIGSGLSFSGGTLTASGSGSSIYYNVQTYGASPSASAAANTTAFQNAINAAAAAGGGTIFIPAGIYLVNGPINITTSNITVLGEGTGSTNVKQDTNGSDTFVINGHLSACQINNLSITSSVADAGLLTGGAAIKFINDTTAGCGVNNVFIFGCYIGIEIDGSWAVLSNINIYAYKYVGIYYHQTVNYAYTASGMVSNFLLSAGYPTLGQLGGIRMVGRVEGVIMTNGSILQGTYGMTTDAVTYAFSLRPAYNQFTNVGWDSSSRNLNLQKSQYLTFVNCWISGGRDSTTSVFPGIWMNESEYMTFIGCEISANGAQGVYVGSACKHTTFSSCGFNSNNILNVATSYAGIEFAPGTNLFVVEGCNGNNVDDAGHQYTACLIGSSCNNFAVTNNMFSSYLSPQGGGGITNNAGTSATQIVANNIT